MRLSPDEYRVYMISLPGDINEAVRMDANGFASIYINDCLSPAARRAAFDHAVQHIVRNDHFNDLSIREAEGCPEQKSNA